MIRELKFSAGEYGTEPDYLVSGGVQGEDAATRVKFNIAEEVIDKLDSIKKNGNIYYRFEIHDSTGVVDMRDSQILESGTVTVELTHKNTANGGNIKVFLVLYVDTAAEIEYFTFPAHIRLEGKRTVSDKEYESISELSIKAREAMSRAETAAQTAAADKSKVENYESSVSAKYDALFKTPEWIFDGGTLEDMLNGGDGAIDFDLLVDTELSGTSENPVQNNKIKKEFDSVRDEISALPSSMEFIEGLTVNSNFKAAVKELMIDIIAPVGCVKIFADGTDPKKVYGNNTVWKRIDKGYIYCSKDGGDLGYVKGSEEITLNINQLPKHQHKGLSWGGSRVGLTGTSASEEGVRLFSGNPQKIYDEKSDIVVGDNLYDKNVSEPQPIEINPPRTVFNVWKRVDPLQSEN